MQENRKQREPMVGPGEISHQVADLTLTASADVTLMQLQDKLAEHDQWLPMDGDPRQSLGRLIAFNSSGPLRLGFGGWRDLLLMAQFRGRSGDFITVGVRTMKNVAGYDVTKFLVGQRNILGDLITVSTRAYRRPAGALIAHFPSDSTLIARLLPTAARPMWAMLRGDRISCGFFGDEKALRFYRETLTPYRPTFDVLSISEEINFRARQFSVRSAAVAFRISVPPTHIYRLVEELALPDCAADPAFGIVVGSCEAEDKNRIARAVVTNGTIIFDDEPPFSRIEGIQKQLIDRVVAAF